MGGHEDITKGGKEFALPAFCPSGFTVVPSVKKSLVSISRSPFMPLFSPTGLHVVLPCRPASIKETHEGSERNRLFTSVIISLMGSDPKFDYGDRVQVKVGNTMFVLGTRSN